MTQEISLDDLFKEAKAAMRSVKAAASRVAPAEKDPLTEGLYRNPDNWVSGKTIVLIHEESGSVLGFYQELRHKVSSDARRLIRLPEGATLVHTKLVEYVKGDWWTTKQTPIAPKRAWHVNLPTTLPLQLLGLGVYAPETPILACFGEGRLERVELLADTQFAALNGLAEFLTLPAGAEILNTMSAASVRDLKRNLGQPE